MRLSFDDKRLVTTGKDGSLCIWKVSACVVGEGENGEDGPYYVGCVNTAFVP